MVIPALVAPLYPRRGSPFWKLIVFSCLLLGVHPHHAAGAQRPDPLDFSFSLKDVTDKELASLDDVSVEAHLLPDRQQHLLFEHWGKANNSGNGVYTAKVLPADNSYRPANFDGTWWAVQIQARGFRPAYLVRQLKGGEGRITGKDGRIAATLRRDTSAWVPKFRAAQDLAPDLRSAIKSELYLGRRNLKVSSLKGLFDLDVGHGSAVDLARAALLNLYHVLSTTYPPPRNGEEHRSWFSYVDTIHVIDQERLIGLAKPELFDIVAGAARDADSPCSAYREVSPFLHPMEDPASTFWNGKKGMAPSDDAKSIKSPLCQGNVQITVARFKRGDFAETLVDFDIDEHLDLLSHMTDVAIHHVTRKGTDPLEVGELLRLLNRNKPLELGYELVPRNASKQLPQRRGSTGQKTATVGSP